MYELFYWPTPNGNKILIFLEEMDLDYRLVPINIFKGDQFNSDFLRISPNNKVPALLDTKPKEGNEPLSIFESGAILLYLAEKTKSFIPPETQGRYEVLQWLFWQMAGLGPMAGQNHHFTQYAQEKIPYAIDRYVNETARLYKVLDKQLEDRAFIAGDYSIADMACYPWIFLHERQRQSLNDFPNLKRWFKKMKNRTGVQKAYQKAEEFKKEFNADSSMTEEARKILFSKSIKMNKDDKANKDTY